MIICYDIQTLLLYIAIYWNVPKKTNTKFWLKGEIMIQGIIYDGFLIDSEGKQLLTLFDCMSIAFS